MIIHVTEISLGDPTSCFCVDLDKIKVDDEELQEYWFAKMIRKAMSKKSKSKKIDSDRSYTWSGIADDEEFNNRVLVKEPRSIDDMVTLIITD